jgi:hypothetical protein
MLNLKLRAKRSLLTALLVSAGLVVACDDEPLGPTLGSISINLVRTDTTASPPAVPARATEADDVTVPDASVKRVRETDDRVPLTERAPRSEEGNAREEGVEPSIDGDSKPALSRVRRTRRPI